MNCSYSDIIQTTIHLNLKQHGTGESHGTVVL